MPTAAHPALMRWQIDPLVGLGPLKLGMTRAQVGLILDPMHAVDDFSDAFGGGKNEFRGLMCPSVSYAGDESKGFAATGFEVGWRVRDVYLDEFDIFDHPSQEVMRYLEHRNSGALAGVGSVLFAKLGINTTGFYDEKSATFFDVRSGDQDDRTLAVFPKGGFDSLLGQFHQIGFGND